MSCDRSPIHIPGDCPPAPAAGVCPLCGGTGEVEREGDAYPSSCPCLGAGERIDSEDSL